MDCQRVYLPPQLLYKPIPHAGHVDRFSESWSEPDPKQDLKYQE